MLTRSFQLSVSQFVRLTPSSSLPQTHTILAIHHHNTSPGEYIPHGHCFALSALVISIIAHRLASTPDFPNPYSSHMTPKLIFDIVFGL